MARKPSEHAAHKKMEKHKERHLHHLEQAAKHAHAMHKSMPKPAKHVEKKKK